MIRLETLAVQHLKVVADLNHPDGVRDKQKEDFLQVVVAIKRHHAKKSSFCENCGGKIPPERLRAHPTATRCVPCQAEKEAKVVKHKRHRHRH